MPGSAPGIRVVPGDGMPTGHSSAGPPLRRRICRYPILRGCFLPNLPLWMGTAWCSRHRHEDSAVVKDMLLWGIFSLHLRSVARAPGDPAQSAALIPFPGVAPLCCGLFLGSACAHASAELLSSLAALAPAPPRS